MAEAGWRPRAAGREPQEYLCLVQDNQAKVGGEDCYTLSSERGGRTETRL